MKTLAILFALCFAAPSSAQYVVYYTQCGPGGCCPGGGCPGGNCGPQFYGPPPQYSQPRRQPQQERPEPDGIETPEVGALGTPQFIPNPPAPAPPFPSPPPVQTPAMPPKAEPGPMGPQGPVGPQGPAGASIDPKILGEFKQALNDIKAKPGCSCDNKALEAKMDTLIAAVTAIKIPAPVAPAAPVAQPAAEEHVVIVADHNADYWQKLSEAMTTTNQTYHGVQESTLPEFSIGIHPQAVIYRNSVPIRIVKGFYNVQDLLARLSRGDSI